MNLAAVRVDVIGGFKITREVVVLGEKYNTLTVGDIGISNQFLITHALHFA